MVARTSSNPDDFVLPDLGEGLEEAELIEWSVSVGQSVKENDVLAKMETAKALVDVPSPRAGVIAALHAKPGQVVKVGSPLVTYRQNETAADEVDASARGGNGADAGTVVGHLVDTPGIGGESGHVLATPAIRLLARERGVDIESLSGTGIGGRITAQDVESAARKSSPARKPVSPSRSSPQQSRDDDALRVPFRGVRRTIAEHLRYSVSHAIHFTVMDEADVTALEALRRKLIAASNEKISLLPFVASAVCRVLSGAKGAHFKRVNSTVDDDRQEIVQHRSIHLGIATDTDSGLMVPVIRDADRLGVLEISRQIADLARSARDRSIPPHRLTGSTFTISNFGAFAGRFGTPIINYPEAAILAVGRAREGVVVRDGMMGVGKLLPLSLSADHRVVDGATAAATLAKLIELLQDPDELLSPLPGV